MSDLAFWDILVGNNNFTPPDGWPEGMLRSDVNNSAREMMRALRAWYEQPEFQDLFTDKSQTPTRGDTLAQRLTPDTIQLNTGVSEDTKFQVGTRVLLMIDGGAFYGHIKDPIVSGPPTQFDVELDTESEIPNPSDPITGFYVWLGVGRTMGSGAYAFPVASPTPNDSGNAYDFQIGTGDDQVSTNGMLDLGTVATHPIGITPGESPEEVPTVDLLQEIAYISPTRQTFLADPFDLWDDAGSAMDVETAIPNLYALAFPVIPTGNETFVVTGNFLFELTDMNKNSALSILLRMYVNSAGIINVAPTPHADLFWIGAAQATADSVDDFPAGFLSVQMAPFFVTPTAGFQWGVSYEVVSSLGAPIDTTGDLTCFSGDVARAPNVYTYVAMERKFS